MSTYNKIYVARIIVEADTPLFVGSGEVGLLSDMQVQRDHLGLPMIMGTTLAGVLRNEFQSNKKKEISQALEMNENTLPVLLRLSLDIMKKTLAKAAGFG